MRPIVVSRRGGSGVVLVIAVALIGWLVALVGPAPAHASPLTMCGNAGTPPPIQHVVVMFLENESNSSVLGNAKAPYINHTLTSQCGVATSAFGITHTSGANYLGTSAGQYPPNSPPGCGTVKTCSSAFPSLYSQLLTAGLSWRDYVEGATSNCAQTPIANVTKIGHNPGLFFPNINCSANVVPVASLTQPTPGNFWDEASANDLPSFSWISPDLDHVGQGSAPVVGQEAFLSQFLPQFTASAAYQSGTTALVISYDEGNAKDAAVGEDCTNQAKDMLGAQESCHIPLWVVYPYNPGGNDSSFLDLYSITKGVEDLFGLPYLAHAGDAQTTSLLGHFGLALPVAPAPVISVTPTPTDSPTATDTPTPTPTDSVTPTPTPTDSVTPTPTPTPTDDPSPTPTPSASPPPPPPPPVNDLFATADPSVEASGANFLGLWNGNSKPTWAADQFYAGLHSIKVTNKATAAGDAGLNYKGPTITSAAKGTVYTGTAWVRTTVAKQKISITVREAGTAAGSSVSSLTFTDTGWHQLATSYTAKAPGDTIKFSVYASALAPAAGFYADVFDLTTPG